jgi:hypothetical protein
MAPWKEISRTSCRRGISSEVCMKGLHVKTKGQRVGAEMRWLWYERGPRQFLPALSHFSKAHDFFQTRKFESLTLSMNLSFQPFAPLLLKKGKNDRNLKEGHGLGGESGRRVGLSNPRSNRMFECCLYHPGRHWRQRGGHALFLVHRHLYCCGIF